jgi:hypothetical protein
MADEDEDEEQAPAVALGPGDPVEGAPLARVASRLTWPIQKNRVETLEGDSVVRTSEGPRELADLLTEVDVTYFDRRSTFESAVREVAGEGPIPTASDDPTDDVDTDTDTEAEAEETETETKTGTGDA